MERLYADLTFRPGCARKLTNLHVVVAMESRRGAMMRWRNRSFLMQQLTSAGFPNIRVAIQGFPNQDATENSLVAKLATTFGSAQALSPVAGHERDWKARQVNAMVDGIPTEDYIFQLDPDVIPPIRAICSQWKHVMRKGVDFLRPWSSLTHLDHNETTELIKHLDVYFSNRPHRTVDTLCARGFIIRKGLFDRIGGLSTDHLAHGWEADSLRSAILSMPSLTIRDVRAPAVSMKVDAPGR